MKTENSKKWQYLSKFNSIFWTSVRLYFFYTISRVIAPSKGMNFSDEGHYLLSSDPSELTDALGWPYGWNLHYLYKISDYSISDFRIYGFTLLLFTNYRFSRKLLQSLKIGMAIQFSKLETALFYSFITSSSLLFYAGFLRSPSYNWLNFVGLIVFLTGTFQLITHLYKPLIPLSNKWFYKFEIALGLFIALPAKPSTVGFGLISLCLSILAIKNLRTALQTFLQVILIIFSFIILSILTNFWPTTILNQFAQVLRMPPLTPNHTLLGASLDLIITPLKLMKSLAVVPEAKLVLFVFIFSFLNFFRKFRRFDRQYLFFIVFWVALLSLAIHFWSLRDFNKNLSQKQFWLENISISNSYLILILFFVLYSFIGVERINFSRRELKSFLTFSKLIYLNLIVSLLAFGFGSSGGILRKLPLSSSLLAAILASQVIVLVKSFNLRTSILVALNSFVFFIVLIVFIGSYNNPYRSEGLSKMVYPTKIGNHNSSIFLDQKTSNQINDLRNSAVGAGFSRYTPTINLVYPSEIGIGYALGGRQSPTIQFAWFGYSGSLSQSKYLLSKSYGRFDFEDSWILKSPDEQYGTELSILQDIIQDVQSRSRKKFPGKYTLVYEDNELELWKPVLD